MSEDVQPMDYSHSTDGDALGAYPWLVNLLLGVSFSGITHHLFYEREEDALVAYRAVEAAIKDSNARKNDAPHEIELTDAVGLATFEVRNMTGVRLVNNAELTARGEAAALAWTAKVHATKAAAQSSGEPAPQSEAKPSASAPATDESQ